MAQVTAQSPTATPGHPYVFVAKAAAVGYTWTHALNGQISFKFLTAEHGSDQIFATAFLKVTAGTNVYLRIWDDTDSAAVGAVVSTDAVVPTRVKTAAVTMENEHEYFVEMGVITGVDEGEVSGPYGFWDAN